MIHSPKLGDCYHVNNVKGRDSILIHSANFAGDVDLGFKTHLLGCIALGQKFGVVDGQLAVLLSTAAISAFHREMNRQPFDLEVMSWTSERS